MRICFLFIPNKNDLFLIRTKKKNISSHFDFKLRIHKKKIVNMLRTKKKKVRVQLDFFFNVALKKTHD